MDGLIQSWLKEQKVADLFQVEITDWIGYQMNLTISPTEKGAVLVGTIQEMLENELGVRLKLLLV